MKTTTPPALTLAGLCLLTACASQPPDTRPSHTATQDQVGNAVATALRQGKLDQARALLATELRSQPDNGYWHLLNGLSYQLAGDSPQTLDLAAVGYEAAARFSRGYYWADYCLGSVTLQRGDAGQASEHFARAILDDPARPEGFLGLAVAAYSNGDLPVARMAAARALELAPRDVDVIRTAVFAAAASGDRPLFDERMASAAQVPAAAHELETQQPRLQQLLRVSQVQSDTAPATSNDAAPLPVPDQVMIEVTLLLSQSSKTTGVGVNLLDGLTMQFGGSRTTQHDVTDAINTTHRSVTTALSIPQINYSLNLFNTRNDYYEVVAHPSLVATVGQTSEFFIGRTLVVGVSGVNLGSLQPVDVGTSVKVTPVDVTPLKTRFRVDAQRSFFATQAGGSTFDQQLTTFKQSVSATVEVEFGKTMILSGLYEGVSVGESSKVPGLGDVPIVNTFFRSKDHTSRQDAALILVTPRLPGSFETGTREFRGETLEHLLKLWNDFVEPTSGLDATLRVIDSSSRWMRGLKGDVRAPSANDSHLVAAMLDDTLRRLR